jgi:uridine kinase
LRAEGIRARRFAVLAVPHLIRSIDSVMSQVRASSAERGFTRIAVDGCGGAGKSTFARKLARWAGDAQIVAMDDFYKPASRREKSLDVSLVGSLFDWQRLEREVLRPRSSGVAGRYQRYDWASDKLAEWHDLAPTGLVIVEGVYTARLELAAYYSFIFWVEAPREERLRRGIARNGQASHDRWQNEWMPAEDEYVRTHLPQQRADVVVDATGAVVHDDDAEVVCIVSGHSSRLR